MCGILGVAGPEAGGFADAIRAETLRMRCRGPDASGFFQDSGIVMGHRRLAILDLSPRSNQPLSVRSDTLVMTYNGEIYNFHDIDPSVDSDTLALLGDPPKALDPRLLRGMFAFALWDVHRRHLSLTRDRFGMKPLYYGTRGKNLIFASTAAAVARLLDQSNISLPAVASFLRLGSVQGPQSIYTEVREVDPGSILHWEDGTSYTERYWTWEDARNKPADDLHTTLRDAVAAHCISDVPVAIFLSGGLDSAIVSALAAEAGIDATALTLGFPGLEIDETASARETALSFGVKHEVIETDDPLDLIEEYFEDTDQPSVDGLNTYLITGAAAQRGFRVALSGVGADELFAGYSTFRRIPLLAGANALCPAPLATRLFALMSANRAKAGDLARCGVDFSCIYEELRSVFSRGDVSSLLGVTWQLSDAPTAGGSVANTLTRLELQTYLRNTLLRDADVFSMAHSLELRTPFVDHLVLCSALDLKSRSRILYGKRLVSDAISTPRLRHLAKMPKRGFSLPYSQWLRSALRPRVDELVAGPLSGLCDGPAVQRHVDAWRDGTERDVKIWALVVLDAWLRRQTGRAA